MDRSQELTTNDPDTPRRDGDRRPAILTEQTIICRLELSGQRSDEERFTITIEIGAPYRSLEGSEDESEEWACPVAIRPLINCVPDIRGFDAFQALCLAIALVRRTLNNFREQGGWLMDPSGDDFALEAYDPAMNLDRLGDSR